MTTTMIGGDEFLKMLVISLRFRSDVGFLDIQITPPILAQRHSVLGSDQVLPQSRVED